MVDSKINISHGDAAVSRSAAATPARQIGRKTVGPGHPVYVVGEIGINAALNPPVTAKY